MKQKLDSEWDQILSGRNENCLPHDPEINRIHIEHWMQEFQAPKGCSLHPGYHRYPERPHWQCKIYLGGQQRVIGVGHCDQMALLYDAARIFFKKYRTNRESFGDSGYNTNAEVAKQNVEKNLFLKSYLETIEFLLIKRKELLTPEDKDNRQKEIRHSRYTTAGQLKHTMDLIFERLENITLGLESIKALIENKNEKP